MRYDGELIVMVGNIGSGKSTYVKDFYACDGYAVVSRDALRYMLGGGSYVFEDELESSVFHAEHEMLSSLMWTGVNVVVDGTHMNRDQRGKLLFLSKQHGYTATAIIMPRFSKEKSVNHRIQKPHGQYNKKMWETIWEKFDKLYEEPTIEEGFDKIKCIEDGPLNSYKKEKCIGCECPLTNAEIEKGYEVCSACVDDMNRALEGAEAHPIAKEEDKEEMSFEHMDEYELADWVKTLPKDYPFLYIEWK